MRDYGYRALALAAVVFAAVTGARGQAAEEGFIPDAGAAPAAGAKAGSDKLAETVARLVEENAQLRAELAEKQRQLDTLLKRLADDPHAAGPAAAEAAAASAAGDAAGAADSDEKAAAKATAAASGKGPWAVRILSNEDPSVGELREQLAEAKAKLPDIDRRLAEAKRRRDFTATDRRATSYNYRRGYDTKRTFTVAEQGEARLEVQRIEGERRRAMQAVARAERQIQDAGKARIVVGQLEDGTTVEMTAQGEAAIRLSRVMQVGERYRVTGTGSAEGGVLRIRMTGAVLESGGAPRAAAPAAAGGPAARTAGAPTRGRPAAPPAVFEE